MLETMFSYRKHYLVQAAEKKSFTGKLFSGAAAASHAAGRRLHSMHLQEKLSSVKSSVKNALHSTGSGAGAGGGVSDA